MHIAPPCDDRRPATGFLMHKTLRMAGLAMLLSTLAACGGGGASSSPNNGGGTSTTINAISPAGVVVATPATLTISGSNFSTGMSINVNDGRVSTNVTPSSVTSNSIVIPLTVNTVPAGNYATLSVLAPSGAVLASAVVGVAGSAKNLAAHIQPIFDSVCIGCHSGQTPSGGLNLNSAFAAAALINTYSAGGCSARFRVTPGDPRRTSSVLIDKIQAVSGTAACSGQPMPPAGFSLSAQQIQDIVDWVAGGAN